MTISFRMKPVACTITVDEKLRAFAIEATKLCKGSIKPILGRVRVHRLDSHTAEFHATDLEVTLLYTHPAKFHPDLDCNFTLDLKRFAELADEELNESIVFDVEPQPGSQDVVIRAGSGFKTTDNGSDAADFPMIPSAKPTAVEVSIPSTGLVNFLDTLGRMRKLCDTARSRFAFQGLHLWWNNEPSLRAYATNGKVIGIYDVPHYTTAYIAPGTTLRKSNMPLSVVNLIASRGFQKAFCASPLRIVMERDDPADAASTPFTHLQLGPLRIISHDLTGAVPIFPSLIPKDTTKVCDIQPIAVETVLGRLRKHAENGAIWFTGDDAGRLRCVAKMEGRESSMPLPEETCIAYAEFRAGLNVDYLLDLITFMDTRTPIHVTVGKQTKPADAPKQKPIQLSVAEILRKGMAPLLLEDISGEDPSPYKGLIMPVVQRDDPGSFD